MDAATAFAGGRKHALVDGLKIGYVEAGCGSPPVVLLHGIPTNANLWRNVLPAVSRATRTVAFDLLGFGDSDKPTTVDYDLKRHTRCLAGAVEALGLRGAIIVGLDLGLLVGLNYAMANEADVAGVVMFEGFFLPMDVAYRNLGLFNRLTLGLMKNKRFAERVIARDGVASIARMIAMSTVRELSEEEIRAYQDPFRDEEVRRKVWLEGVGPTKIGRRSTTPGDLVDMINRYAERLRTSRVPKLLLHADPGMVVTRKNVDFARATIANLEIKHIGVGKHLLPEDQPDAVADAIVAFSRRLAGRDGGLDGFPSPDTANRPCE